MNAKRYIVANLGGGVNSSTIDGW